MTVAGLLWCTLWCHSETLPSRSYLICCLSCTSCHGIEGCAAISELLSALRMSNHTTVPALHHHLPKADPLPTRRAGLRPDHLEGNDTLLHPRWCWSSMHSLNVNIKEVAPHNGNIGITLLLQCCYQHENAAWAWVLLIGWERVK